MFGFPSFSEFSVKIIFCIAFETTSSACGLLKFVINL